MLLGGEWIGLDHESYLKLFDGLVSLGLGLDRTSATLVQEIP